MTRTESSTVVPSHVVVATGPASAGNVIWLRGDYDLSVVTSLSYTMARATTRAEDLVVDLSGVTFMDAATIGVIIGARNHLRRQYRSLALRFPSRCAWRVLHICGLTDLLDPAL